MAFSYMGTFYGQKFGHLGLVPGFATGAVMADHIKTSGKTTAVI
jgi:hypothetical protein